MQLRTIVILVFVFSISAFAQQQKNNSVPFLRNFILSLEGGTTLSKSDFDSDKIGLGALGSVEYFLPSNSASIFGIRASVGGLTLKGQDKTKTPDNFRTDIYSIGIGLTYNHSFENKYFPFFYFGTSYLWYSPKDKMGQRLPNNILKAYEKQALAFDVKFGMKFLLSQKLSINFSSGLHFLNNDYFDDVKAGTSNDFYLSGMVGLSYALSSSDDTDSDGIMDSEDYCPELPEDFDGFEDYDGCPDPDNDGDGIPDIRDACPDEAEDMDGFKDYDGCPEYDNDEDGILDHNDKCPNEAEDFDGFEDADGCPDVDIDNDGILDYKDNCPRHAEDFDGFEDDDGCPDFDNDNDGIIDTKDDCPNDPENFNGYQDEDGCPDIKPLNSTEDNNSSLMLLNRQQVRKDISPSFSTKEILIHGEITFESNKAIIKQSANSLLDKIVELLKLYPDSKWEIIGHMDNSLDKAESAKLSIDRANSVKQYFTSKGLSSSQFEAIGLGDKEPIESNSTAYGRMRNRRVVLKRIQ